MPAVSVIMPAYNAETFLPAAIESVLRQTFWDLELLVVDDGSSDRTPAIAREYERIDSRVRVLAQPNAGPGPARNAAFRQARGRLFAFLDSDDEWDPTFLAEQLAIMGAHPDIDVLVGNARNRGGRRHGQASRPAGTRVERLTLARMIADEECLFIMTVFRREAAEAVGGFDPAFFTNEEYEMWLRAALAGFVFARNPRPLGWYRCRPDSLSAGDARMLGGIVRVYAKVRPLLAEGSAERVVLDRQMARFEAELAAVEARLSLERGDAGAAAEHLTRLRAYRGGATIRIAAALMTHAPRAGQLAYRIVHRARVLVRALSAAASGSRPARETA